MTGSPSHLKSIRGQIFPDYRLAPLTTWKIGGPAQSLIVPADLGDLYEIYQQAWNHHWPLFFLGRGSNLLISDRGLPGLTLHLAPTFKDLQLDGDCLRVGAGVFLPVLARYLADQGVGGYEFLAGIPGTVGAAVRVNAGIGPGQEIASRLRQVTVFTPQLQLLHIKAGDLDFGYRHSRLLNFPHWLVVAAEFQVFETAPPAAILARIHRLIRARQAKFPPNSRNCGSVFKNPSENCPAGWLIDQAGLKGITRGDAQISTDHANFIVNRGHATADQVRALIAHIQETIWKLHGIALEREVVFLPDDLWLPS